MGKYIIVLCIVLNATTYIIGQEVINNVEMPTSPAAYEIGIQPSSILLRESSEALILSIFSNFQNKKSSDLVPNDYALEFSPYWSSGPQLTLKNYLFPGSSIVELYRNLSISLASTNHYLLGDSTETSSIGIGLRSKIHFMGYGGKDTLLNRIKKLEKSLMIRPELNLIVDDAIDAIISDVNNDPAKYKMKFYDIVWPEIEKKLKSIYPNVNLKEIGSFMDGIKDKLDKLPEISPKGDNSKFTLEFLNLFEEGFSTQEVFNELESEITNRQGLTIEFAAAALINFPTNNVEKSVIPRYSIWITPAYRVFSGSIINFLGVFRYEFYNMDYYRQYFSSNKFYDNHYDLGIAISIEFGQFSFHCEAIRRLSNSDRKIGQDNQGRIIYVKDEISSYQYLGTFNYNITKGISVNYSFGKGYDPVLVDKNVLVSQLSLNMGFGAFNTGDVKSVRE